MQNDALAISLVSVFFAPAVAIPAAVGAAIHQVTGSVLAGIFARHMEAREQKQRAAIKLKRSWMRTGKSLVAGRLSYLATASFSWLKASIFLGMKNHHSDGMEW